VRNERNYNLQAMENTHIAELLQPFLPAEGFASLSQRQLQSISDYLDLLLRWNARVNLTAVREPEAIVTRHFGESFFAARHLFSSDQAKEDLIDLGSGAGFPGLAIKIVRPSLRVTLIESNQKKATFLREAIRKLTLTEVNVFSGRGEDFSEPADVVTLRAVEHFDRAVPLALKLARPGGRIALLIGEAQVLRARELAASVYWNDPARIPLASGRVLLIGRSEP
jgi:16S rRNA (guanine527-N7)-methyltransferase